MNHNVTQDYPAVVAWTGTAANPVMLLGTVYFGFTFQAMAALTDDAVFTVDAAPVSDTDLCAPGEFKPVMHIEPCASPSLTTIPEEIKIAKGTAKGQLCYGTLPCPPGAFIRLAAKSGPTKDIMATVTLGGKRS